MSRQVKKGGCEGAEQRAETHEMRSRWLAAEKVWNIERLAKTQEERLLASRIVARISLVKSDRSHERAEFAALAMSAFGGTL